MRILIWHVHGSWMTSFVQGKHEYLIPSVADLGPDGRGRAQTWEWPDAAMEVTPEAVGDGEFDLVVVQRPRDVELFSEWSGGRVLGRDVPVIWLEHNTPQGRINEMKHPSRQLERCLVVHVTHTNSLLWDCGDHPTTVVEHGVPDPGHRYSGEIESCAVVVNEPSRRGRVVGADLLPGFAQRAPIDIFGMGVEEFARQRTSPAGDVAHRTGPTGHETPGAFDIRPFENLRQDKLHDELPRRRLYLHPYRWTSLGLSLIEAMLLGMPVVALSMTEVPDALGRASGYVSNDLDHLGNGIQALIEDIDFAREMGEHARNRALERFGLERFLADWDQVLENLCG